MKKLTYIAAAAALITLTGCGTKTIHPFDGVEFTFSGADGYGRLDSFDVTDGKGFEAIQKELDKAGDKMDVEKGFTLMYLIENFDCTADRTDHLSNGDKVTIACEYNPEQFKQMGYKVAESEKTITVSGLQTVKEVDLFKDVEPVWIEAGYLGGYKPSAEAKQEIEGITYNASYDADTETVTISTNYKDNAEKMIKELGFAPLNGEMERSYPANAPVRLDYAKCVADNDKAGIQAFQDAAEEYIGAFRKAGWRVQVFPDDWDTDVQYYDLTDDVEIIDSGERTEDWDGNSFAVVYIKTRMSSGKCCITHDWSPVIYDMRDGTYSVRQSIDLDSLSDSDLYFDKCLVAYEDELVD